MKGQNDKMLFKRLHKSKKGAFAIPLTIFYIALNVLFFILISAFAQDGVDIGQTTAQSFNVDENTSTNADVSITKAKTWTGSFKTTIFGLPWWLDTILVVFEVAIGGLVVYALIRGL